MQKAIKLGFTVRELQTHKHSLGAHPALVEFCRWYGEWRSKA